MYEPEAESDEDCEVYFLKPVNEYNIVDKIKEANKELFALEADDDGNANDAKDATTAASSRKVTFALNLENYEPTSQQETQLPSPPDELLQQLAQLKLKPNHERFAPIAEEPAKEQEKTAELQLQESQLHEQQIEVEPEEEEEICEEILELTEVEVTSSSSVTKGEQMPATVSTANMDYEDDVADENDDDDFSGVDEDDLTAAPETLANETQKRRISRQNTFDCNYEPTEGESDQRSLTNLLTESDCEEDERAVNEARLKLREAYKSLYKTLDTNGQAQLNRLTSSGNEVADVDEDDDLSIIAANYIPDDFELNERSIYYKKDDEMHQNQQPQQQQLRTTSPISSNTISSTSTKTFFNSRRFSFRRRARATPSVSSSSTTAAPEIKMNYKICCEHRHALQDKLPKYTGYMSEYGLSAKQLQQRDQQLRRKQRFSMEQTLNRNEHELKKMQDNERAFTTWLKNKMRYPINKTRNMFDTTRRRASVAAVNSPNPHQKHQRQHSQQEQAVNRRRDSIEVHPYRHLLGSWNK
ncbi:uncharacterized protein LOC117568251 [Drosophila albomicans]|uniref:Coiled-coil domain-containing protein 181 n=1 Tax=Drosophila albomicans TaxID=7291 RepID=A0A6P8Y8E2_DROAB|nr:uncharacterized protein LOC117568251 [Drosophila albomicans]